MQKMIAIAKMSRCL